MIGINFINKYFHIHSDDMEAYKLAKTLLRFRLELKLIKKGIRR